MMMILVSLCVWRYVVVVEWYQLSMEVRQFATGKLCYYQDDRFFMFVCVLLLYNINIIIVLFTLCYFRKQPIKSQNMSVHEGKYSHSKFVLYYNMFNRYIYLSSPNNLTTGLISVKNFYVYCYF